MRNLYTLDPLVEALIPKLWTKQEQSYSVDYLEEAIRRFSDAKIRAGEFDGVKIRSTTRPRKVCTLIQKVLFATYTTLYSGRRAMRDS